MKESEDFVYQQSSRNKFWQITDYSLNSFQENIELLIYSSVAFLVPFLIGHPQLFVGIIVNTAIVLTALNLKNTKILPIVVLPSIAVLSRGLIFGPFTLFLFYMIPFIWIGNFILLAIFKELKLKRKLNNITALILGAGAKAGFLFAVAFVLVKTGLLPALFLTSMGVTQLYTALAGGALAIGIHEAKKKYIFKKSKD